MGLADWWARKYQVNWVKGVATNECSYIVFLDIKKKEIRRRGEGRKRKTKSLKT